MSNIFYWLKQVPNALRESGFRLTVSYCCLVCMQLHAWEAASLPLCDWGQLGHLSLNLFSFSNGHLSIFNLPCLVVDRVDHWTTGNSVLSWDESLYSSKLPESSSLIITMSATSINAPGLVWGLFWFGGSVVPKGILSSTTSTNDLSLEINER